MRTKSPIKATAPTKVATKVCSSCRRARDISFFSKAKRPKDNLQSRCKCCSKDADKRRRELRKQALLDRNIKVEAKTCKACRTYRSAEHFHLSKETRDGLDCACISCRSMLDREKGIHKKAMRWPALTPEETWALVLLREARKAATRKRKVFDLDWTDALDLLEDFKLPKRAGAKRESLALVLVDSKGSYVAGNVRLVLSDIVDISKKAKKVVKRAA